MVQTERGVVIGVFEDRKAVTRTINTLIDAGFHEDQLGFAARGQEEHIHQVNKQAGGPNSVLRGVVGGLLGVADMLLVPITGPAEAATILANVLPVTEEAIDHLPYPGSKKDEEVPVRPDAAMTIPAEQAAQPIQSSQIHTESVANDASRASTSETTKEVEQAAVAPARTGIVAGSVIGGVLGAAAALLLPGIGPVVAGGVLASIFGGGAIGGVAGGFLGAFTGMGVPADQAHYYEREIKAGRTILTVHTVERQQEVTDILRQNGAHDVQAHG
ncbi:MAG: hypothetical protein H0U76_09810 [Ktedonobacteraceae bacterium]|nr:hypothetical protein [Ktedonobacteraceae bacterium]